MFHFKTRVSGFLCALLIFLLSGTALAAEAAAPGFSDTGEHWAGQVITDWAGQGLTGGYPDGTFRPDAQVSRAEFIALLNRALGLQKAAAISFSDVAATNWFYRDIAIAAQAGFVTGYSDGSMKPAHPISREEAAVIMARVLKLADNPSGTQAFSDHAEIASWSRVAVGAVSSSLYMGGYPDGTFAPAKPITRAESVTILSRIAGSIYREAGVFGPAAGTQTIAGNVTVTAGDVTLQNMVIEGALHLSAGVGNSSVTLKNVTVKGTTLVCGGGTESVILEAGTVLGQVVVDKRDGAVRIFAREGSTVRIVVAENGLILDQASDAADAFGELVVSVPVGAIVEIRGHVESLTLESPETTINILSGASVGTMTIAGTAVDSVINLAAGASVADVQINAPVDVTGKGTIETASILVDGVTIAQEPKEVVLADNVTSEVGGETVTGEETEEEVVGGGGGGGGTPETQFAITSVSMDFNDVDVSGSVNNYIANIDLADKSDASRIEGFTINGLPAGTTLTLGSSDTATTMNDGYIGISSLLSGFQSVSMSGMRQIFGSTVTITGTLQADGYQDTSVSLVLTLSDETSVGQDDNEYFTIVVSGDVFTATVKSGEGTSKVTEIGFESLFMSVANELPIKVSMAAGHSPAYSVTTEREAIKTAIAAANSGDWNSLTLEELDVPIYFQSSEGTWYTLLFN